jgi:hypothetical protein
MPFIIDPAPGVASDSDRRRIVRISSAGTVTTVIDLENGSSYYSTRGSFQVTPGQRKPTMAQSQRRYGGSRQTGETHDNGQIAWKMLVTGGTADAALANFEAAIAVLEAATMDLYFEWRPAGATFSTYYEIRGAATWQPHYEWAQFAGAKSFMGDIRIPVAPLGYGASTTIAIASTTLPATIALGTAIPGNAPALADISLTTSGGTSPPIWALIGWARRPSTPLAGSVAPFGKYSAAPVMVPTTWVSTGDVNYFSGTGLKATAAGAGTASALMAVDPSTLATDDWSVDEVAVEVWARIELASTLVSPRVFLSVQPFAGTAFGAEQHCAEFGTAGKLLTVPSSGTRFRFVKLGTLNLPVDPAAPLKHNIKVAASWATGSSGTFGLDYLVMVPARQRALSASSKPNDATYAKFIASTAATTKTIRSDLSGRVASGAGNAGRDSGLGGNLIQMPPGQVDVLIKLSSLVADDPTLDATTEQLAHTGVTGELRVTPRYWLARPV